MKTKLILAFVIAGAMSFSSCTRKIDEKTMAEVNQVGTDWTAMGEKANAWSQELNQMSVQAKDFAAKQNDMMTKMSNMKDEAMKAKMSEMVKMSNDNVAKLDQMMNDYNTYKTDWDKMTADYMTWKDKVMKGEVSADDAMKGLAEYKTKMSDAQAKMDSWNAMYAETKSSCEKNMAMADEMSKSMVMSNVPVKKK